MSMSLENDPRWKQIKRLTRELWDDELITTSRAAEIMCCSIAELLDTNAETRELLLAWRVPEDALDEGVAYVEDTRSKGISDGVIASYVAYILEFPGTPSFKGKAAKFGRAVALARA